MERGSVVMHGLVNFVVCELTGIHTHVALGATTGGCYRGQGTALDAEVVCVWEGPREQIGIVSIKLALSYDTDPAPVVTDSVGS